MTQFKVGDEVFVKGRVSGHTPQGQIVAYFPAIDSYIPCDSSELVPSPPAAVEQPQEMSWEDVEYTNKGTSGWCMCKHYPVEEWGVPGDSTDFDYRHARTHEPITYDHFLSLVNAAKAKAQPTPVDVLVVHPEETYTEWRKREGRSTTAQGCPPPTAPEVTQATAVYAGMQRERLWADWAGQAINALIHKAPLLDAEGEHGPAFDKTTLTQFRSDMAVSAFDYADAMLAEFDRRFKGGE